MFNKGIILVCLMSLFSLTQLSAQDNFSFGPRVGLNFSNVSNVDNSESLTGLVIGLTTTYSITESTGLTVDILGSSEGYSSAGNDLKLNYLQIPILFDVFFGELGSAFRPKVYAGITPGFLLGAKV
ncbi:MAG: PorT family protein, partial [Bacteroidota bacterium]|nr:PorT family protein [Bacteroidota bacterium]